MLQTALAVAECLALPACVNIIITMFLEIFVVILRSLLIGIAVVSHHFFCVSG